MNRIMEQHCKYHATALLDTGSTRTWIQRHLVQEIPTRTTPPTRSSTLCGTLESSEVVDCEETVFPDLSMSKRVGSFEARVFERDVRYDMIIGRDLLNQLGIIINYNTKSIHWDDEETPMLSGDELNFLSQGPLQLRDALLSKFLYSEENLSDDEFTAEIQAARYGRVAINDVVSKATHLTLEQQQDLKDLLQEFPKLFSGELGRFTGELVHIDIQPDAKPVHKRHYPVARIHEKVFKDEIDRLVSIGVLEPCGRSEWAAPTFIIAKKDKTVRVVTDFRALNKVIKRKVYPLPKIEEILSRRKGYKYFTKLDISMQYYTFELDEASKDLCTISTPFGLYRSVRLPM
jgi:hypothetical protein